MTADADRVPPRNVRLKYRDGRVVPVECVYAGTDAEGVHRWEIVTTSVVLADIETVLIARLPARTSVVLGLDPGDVQ